jgi:hypothetical protein
MSVAVTSCRVGLYLQQQDDVNLPLTMTGRGQRVELRHQLPGADISQGRSPPNQEDLLTMVRSLQVHVGACHQMGLDTYGTCVAGGKDPRGFGGQPGLAASRDWPE